MDETDVRPRNPVHYWTNRTRTLGSVRSVRVDGRFVLIVRQPQMVDAGDLPGADEFPLPGRFHSAVERVSLRVGLLLFVLTVGRVGRHELDPDVVVGDHPDGWSVGEGAAGRAGVGQGGMHRGAEDPERFGPALFGGRRRLLQRQVGLPFDNAGRHAVAEVDHAEVEGDLGTGGASAELADGKTGVAHVSGDVAVERIPATSRAMTSGSAASTKSLNAL